MYVAQTYLGFVAKSAKVYAYFLSEGYVSDRQNDLHQAFLSRAKELGLSTGPEVAVVLPVAGREMDVFGDIQDEPESAIQKFYQQHIMGNTPGLLLSRAPIDTRRGLKSAVFCTFNTAEHPFKVVKQLLVQMSSTPNESRLVRLLDAMNSFVVLKPNFHGVGVDFNAAIERAIEKLNDR